MTIEPYYDDGQVVIYHADCRDVLPMLGSESIDMVFTDPPYGHNNNNGDLISQRENALGLTTDEPETRPIANDDFETANELFRWTASEYARLLAPGGCCCCCCGGGGPDPQFARWSLWLDEVLGFKQMVVWDKGPMGMGWHYRRSYEAVLVAQKSGATCKWYDRTRRVENIIRPDQGIRKIIPQKWQHPTEKPTSLARFFMELHTRPGELVLDPFAGTGSTLIAAKQIGRKSIGVEIEKRWVDIAVRRLEKVQQYFV